MPNDPAWRVEVQKKSQNFASSSDAELPNLKSCDLTIIEEIGINFAIQYIENAFICVHGNSNCDAVSMTSAL